MVDPKFSEWCIVEIFGHKRASATTQTRRPTTTPTISQGERCQIPPFRM